MKDITLKLISTGEIEHIEAAFKLAEHEKMLTSLHEWLKERYYPIIKVYTPEEIYEGLNKEKLFLTYENIKELPHGIGDFKKLKDLHASKNELKNLPSDLSKLSLERLYLKDNSFTEFPDVIFEIESLEYIDIQMNYISELPNKFDQLPNLKGILLSKNNLKGLPQTFYFLKLKSLWLGGNRFNPLISKIIMERFYNTNVYMDYSNDKEYKKHIEMVEEMFQMYMEENLSNRNEKYHYEAEAASGLKHFINWLKNVDFKEK